MLHSVAFNAEYAIVDAVFMECKWLRKNIRGLCVPAKDNKHCKDVFQLSVCESMWMSSASVWVGNEHRFTAPLDECRTSVSESIDESLKLISSTGLGPDCLQQLLKTSCGLVGGEMLRSTHFLLKVRYGFG